MQGDELIGVIIAGDEDNTTDPVGFAISADEVYRNISRSMNGLPVRQLTALENKILAHKAMYGNSRPSVLAALYVHQLFSTTANVVSIRNPLDQPSLASSDLQTGKATLTAFLRLGRICSSLQPGPVLEKVSLQTADSMVLEPGGFASGDFKARSSSSRITPNREGEELYSQLLQYNEGLAIITLILALSAVSPADKGSRLTLNTGAVSMLFALMRELNLLPLPTPRHMEALVQTVCSYNTLPQPVDLEADPQRQVWLAKSLARMIYALHTDRFYLCDGHLSSTLTKFVSAYYDEDVRIVTETMSSVEVSRARSARVYCLGSAFRVPRVFVMDLTSQTMGKQARSEYNPFFGDVVECTELNDTLYSMKIDLEGA